MVGGWQWQRCLTLNYRRDAIMSVHTRQHMINLKLILETLPAPHDLKTRSTLMPSGDKMPLYLSFLAQIFIPPFLSSFHITITKKPHYHKLLNCASHIHVSFSHLQGTEEAQTPLEERCHVLAGGWPRHVKQHRKAGSETASRNKWQCATPRTSPGAGCKASELNRSSYHARI